MQRHSRRRRGAPAGEPRQVAGTPGGTGAQVATFEPSSPAFPPPSRDALRRTGLSPAFPSRSQATDAVFGGGFIGVDAALALRHRGIEVTLVHRNTRLLSQMTDEEGGVFATEKLAEKTGIDVRLKRTVSEILSENGQLKGVRFSDDSTIETQMLIVSIGVSPNSEQLSGDDKGVPVDSQMLAEAGIYTAGDVALTRHAVTGATGIYATYPNAMQQARIAARHLLHGDGEYAGSLNSNVLRKHIDFPIISAGSFEGEPATWQRGDIWRRVYLKDGMINGYLIIGDTRISGYIYQLYISRQRVDRNIRDIISSPRHDAYYRQILGFAA